MGDTFDLFCRGDSRFYPDPTPGNLDPHFYVISVKALQRSPSRTALSTASDASDSALRHMMCHLLMGNVILVLVALLWMDRGALAPIAAACLNATPVSTALGVASFDSLAPLVDVASPLFAASYRLHRCSHAVVLLRADASACHLTLALTPDVPRAG